VPPPYRVDLTRAAARDLRALARRPPDQATLQQLAATIAALAADPRPPGCLKLQGSEFWRVAVEDYRIIYEIADEPPVVTVARIRHRREVYRDL
jgi:mRNA interferase RelE/StbE